MSSASNGSAECRQRARFIVPTHRIQSAKDALARQILSEFRKAGIGIASSTYDLVGFPPIHVRQASGGGMEADRRAT